MKYWWFMLIYGAMKRAKKRRFRASWRKQSLDTLKQAGKRCVPAGFCGAMRSLVLGRRTTNRTICGQARRSVWPVVWPNTRSSGSKPRSTTASRRWPQHSFAMFLGPLFPLPISRFPLDFLNPSLVRACAWAPSSILRDVLGMERGTECPTPVLSYLTPAGISL